MAPGRLAVLRLTVQLGYGALHQLSWRVGGTVYERGSCGSVPCMETQLLPAAAHSNISISKTSSCRAKASPPPYTVIRNSVLSGLLASAIARPVHMNCCQLGEGNAMHFVTPPKLKSEQVRLVSAEAERPNHPSCGGGVASQGGQPARGVLYDNNSDMTL